MKMNWGTGIVFGFILFAGFVFTLIFKMVNSGNDLVKKSYYKSGSDINKEIQIVQASSSLKNGFSIQYLEGEGKLKLEFNNEKLKPDGRIELICLSSDLGDQTQNLDLEKAGESWIQTVVLLKPIAGNWLCEIKGKRGDKDFLIKESFRIYGPSMAQLKP